MKNFFIFIILFVAAFIFGARQCSSNNMKPSTGIVKTQDIENSETTPNTVSDVYGWQYDHKENRPDTSFTYWYTPVSYTQQTEPFPMKGLNTGYRFRCEYITVEFQSNYDGSWATFKQERGTGKFFIETAPGIFSKEITLAHEIEILGRESTHMRFKPFNNEPMTGLKLSKVE
jgi:hypothetical protein